MDSKYEELILQGLCLLKPDYGRIKARNVLPFYFIKYSLNMHWSMLNAELKARQNHVEKG